MADQGERVSAETRQRITQKPQQASLTMVTVSDAEEGLEVP